MLAAIPSFEDRTLSTVQLALRLAMTREMISASLQDYYDDVVKEARLLADDPLVVSGPLRPEVIQLALKLRQASDLREALNRAPLLRDLSSDLASTILSRLETRLAPQDR